MVKHKKWSSEWISKNMKEERKKLRNEIEQLRDIVEHFMNGISKMGRY